MVLCDALGGGRDAPEHSQGWAAGRVGGERPERTEEDGQEARLQQQQLINHHQHGQR